MGSKNILDIEIIGLYCKSGKNSYMTLHKTKTKFDPKKITNLHGAVQYLNRICTYQTRGNCFLHILVGLLGGE